MKRCDTICSIEVCSGERKKKRRITNDKRAFRNVHILLKDSKLQKHFQIFGSQLVNEARETNQLQRPTPHCFRFFFQYTLFTCYSFGHMCTRIIAFVMTLLCFSSTYFFSCVCVCANKSVNISRRTQNQRQLHHKNRTQTISKTTIQTVKYCLSMQMNKLELNQLLFENTMRHNEYSQAHWNRYYIQSRSDQLYHIWTMNRSVVGDFCCCCCFRHSAPDITY